MLESAAGARTASAAGGAAARLPWVDAARGMAVCGVVLFHVCLWHLAPMAATDAASGVVSVWGRLNALIDALRMPVLLSMSGLLASRRIAAGFRAIGRPVAANAWLYAVWLVIYAVVGLVVADGVPHRVDGPADVLAQLLVPDTPLWYLMGLVVYTVVLTLLRRMPGWIVLLGFGLVSWTAEVIDVTPEFWTKILALGLYFAIGARFPQSVRSLASRATVPRALLVAGALAALIWADRFFPSVELSEAFERVRGIAVVIGFGCIVAVLVRWAPLRWFARVIGRRTLWIYVLHVPVIQLLITVLPPDRLAHALPTPALWLLPVVEAPVVLVVCWAVGRLLSASPGRVLFSPPWQNGPIG
ncbi:acyltransferase [Tersicoccus sp. MR15.9]|uniref:acyltransferase n=1 Tax=Tersicoccus mangrovi TaxID=3121635 RepID=UPI002FE50992